MGRIQRTFIQILLGLSLAARPSANALDFAHDIQLIFFQHCSKCHGAEKQKSGYRLDDQLTAFRGGDSGKAAIVVSNSAASALLQRITTTNAEEVMPPKGGRLSSNEIASIRQWIDSGAAWTTNGSTLDSQPSTPPKHWSFQLVRRPPVPRVRNSKWVRNPIDSFVLARLEGEKLKPSPEAERTVLVRRLFLDLMGLLPEPEMVDVFLNDQRRDAYERLVDSLLASPHFGERWARHWLDLARYADSAGYQIDRVRPGAYLYRDWVINSFNRDQPFDQFTIEQLAGDLLPSATIEQKMATGFHRMTLSNLEDGVDLVEYDCKAKVDRVATTGTTWLGLTVGCAECHTHKYDPITQREFYQLYAFFNEAEELDIVAPNASERERHARLQKRWESEKVQLEEAGTRYSETELPAQQSAWERTVGRGTLTNNVADIITLAPEQRTADQKQELAKSYRDIDPRLKELNAQLKTHQRRAPKYREEPAMFLRANTNAARTFVHIRGDFLTRGEEVRPGVLQALNRFDAPPATNGKIDRLDLARWIVSPENPLTSRVAVNHIWMHLFGRGIVNTPEDFGTRGEAPSHPELLDWLASEFHRAGWSRKEMIRTIVTSATYRQASQSRADLHERDPQNVLLARQSRLRVESEITRDLFLGASGLLNRELGGPSVYPPIPDDVKAAGYGVGGEWVESDAPEKHRRGLYIANRRTVPYPVSMTFDQANANECVARRERSSTPLQPLALLNNPVFAECTEALAKRIATAPGDHRTKLEFGFLACLGRQPSRGELNRLQDLFREEVKHARATEAQAWRSVAEVLLNLDEFLMRE